MRERLSKCRAVIFAEVDRSKIRPHGRDRRQVPVACSHVRLKPEPDVPIWFPLMHQIPESAEVDQSPTNLGLLHIEIVVGEYLLRVLDGMQNSTLPTAVRAEQKRNRLQFNAHAVPDPFEVLDLDGCDHGTVELRL